MALIPSLLAPLLVSQISDLNVGGGEFANQLNEAMDYQINLGQFSFNLSLLIEPLNKRELEVVQLIAEGFTNKEIAQKLYISVRTVKYYTTSIYQKLDVSGRAQAAVKAKELGFLK